MQWKGSRQVTTGLLVNEKVNIRPEYYIKARSMCHNLFSHGTYYRIIPATAIGGTPEKKVITNLDPWQGILTHIAQVRGHSDLRKPVDKKASNSNWLFGCVSLTVRVGPRHGAAVLNRSGSA